MVASTILSRKMIKPFTPTPSSLKRYHLSFRDHISTSVYAPIAAFYSKPSNFNISQVSQILENSLSKVLAFYYPFAGRLIKDDKNIYVDCNDMGAEYLNVQINCPMSEILNHTYNDAIDVVFPQDLPWSCSFNHSPLVVQLSHFDCGGIALGICLSHKITDGYSFGKFANDWAATAREFDFQPSPQFDAVSFFPVMDQADPPVAPNITREPQPCVSRLYHFSSSSLARLKHSVATDNSGGVPNPTRVEVATALLHKCGAAVSMENSGFFRPSLLYHITNLRPPIPLNTIGNACFHYGLVARTKDDINLPNFVSQLQKAKQQLRDKLNYLNINQLASHALEKRKEAGALLERNTFDVYSCSSLCNFGLYTNEFGWGRPIRVTQARHPIKNNFLFLDDPSGDGINALITMTEADMLKFQTNKELLEFATPVAQLSE